MKTTYEERKKVANSIEWRIRNITATRDAYRTAFDVGIRGYVDHQVPVTEYTDLGDYILYKLNVAATTPKSLFGTRIKKVIFNGPATIVEWYDGTKTVVKTQNGEEFDPEKGIAMACVKKMFGNTGAYYNEIKKWIPEKTDETEEPEETGFEAAVRALREMAESANRMKNGKGE